MLMPDVNVLLDAFRADAARHGQARAWLTAALSSGEQIGLSPDVASAVVRIITNPRAYTPPDTIEEALGHLDALRQNASVIETPPGPRHWQIFADLCRISDARGPIVADAAHAAIAIEHGAVWVTFDRDFARFPGLRWELPGL